MVGRRVGKADFRFHQDHEAGAATIQKLVAEEPNPYRWLDTYLAAFAPPVAEPPAPPAVDPDQLCLPF